MQKVLQQFVSRVGRPLKLKNPTGGNQEVYKEVLKDNETYKLGRHIEPPSPTD